MTSRSQHSRSQKSKFHKKKLLKTILLSILGVVCFIGLIASGIVFKTVKDSPPLDFARLEDSLSSRVFDQDGKLIYELGEQKRETVSVKEVPKKLKQAIISIEDKRFEKHGGVDPIRITGAALSNLKGNSRQGGSTLTQQLIKLSFFSTGVEDQTYKRKIQEAWLSLKLEKEKSKDEILNYYINKVYMANRFYGMETAAKGYYGKPLKELDLPKLALLAGLPQAPNVYDPILHPKEAKVRRDMVLKEMYKDEAISKKEYTEAINQPIDQDLIKEQEVSEDTRIIDNYVKEVINEIQTKTKRNVYSDGLDIYTNLDLDVQNKLYELVNNNDTIEFPDDEFQTAVTIMNPENGQVTAQLGGRKVGEDVQMGRNLAVTAERDFGSTVKPLTDYAPAIEYLNYSTGSYLYDGPYIYPGSDIAVGNYDGQFLGNITMRQALIDSRNVPAIKLLEEVGPDKGEKFLENLGITYDEFTLANAIKGDPSSLQMASAYSSLANGGTYYKPNYVKKIVTPDGKETEFKPNGKRAMKESTAYLVTDMLKDVLKEGGTGRRAEIADLPHAGKTGTSNYPEEIWDNVKGDPETGVPDISFVGYTRENTISIWTGYTDYYVPIKTDDQKIAMEIYTEMMTYLTKDKDIKDWEMPENVYKVGKELYVRPEEKKTTTNSSESPKPVYIPPVKSSEKPEPIITTPSSSKDDTPEPVKPPVQTITPESSSTIRPTEPSSEPEKEPEPQKEPEKEPEKTEESVAPPSDEKTEESTTPPVTEKPEESATPPVTEKPEESATPPVTEKPEESATPPATEKPEESATPPVTEKPEEPATPPVTEKPEEPATPPATADAPDTNDETK
ncbi:PBP1A family penicillin-binding protein [Vagococcus intermedius]|uniref:PBP1A family penicillin-binding protein n=1 Tax=Vagococcus intermedius TaxID=2991418 RepID=A0AAF0CTW5_9ENTE|nr:PBP1A family penicillin-binding protein [Vagococcus intermedius]WEG72637.1 PBP1A family penicillin-binding protein [Vagococcus intermedius]WEG74722.1 PBP1A family penicillin-binding protein [Vagococcus intermedius]